MYCVYLLCVHIYIYIYTYICIYIYIYIERERVYIYIYIYIDIYIYIYMYIYVCSILVLWGSVIIVCNFLAIQGYYIQYNNTCQNAATWIGYIKHSPLLKKACVREVVLRCTSGYMYRYTVYINTCRYTFLVLFETRGVFTGHNWCLLQRWTRRSSRDFEWSDL